MNASREVREFIKGWEELRLVPYFDAVGHLTVGWGHVLPPDAEVRRYTRAECEELFEEDILEVEQGVDDCLRVDIPQPCFDALCSFAFNLGVGRLRRSTLLRMINEARLDDATHQFGLWKYATDKKTGKLVELAGLVKRRKAEAEMFEFGDYTGRP